MSEAAAKVVTRFAPSPTGALHVGGARTAMFNRAFARQAQGDFTLRIEDTDRVRSTDASTRGILRDLRWLGLDWDQGPDADSDDCYALDGQRGDAGPYFQSQRAHLYEAALDTLMSTGRAYECFKTADQLDADRRAARAGGKAYQYDPTESLALTPQQRQQYKDRGDPSVIRFRMPDKAITIADEILGEVTVTADQLEDFIIFKGEAAGRGPTFHFANVVDDYHMGVTHVLRGQEHLNNTIKHAALQEALGYPAPKYAHIPLIFNADGSKMSKRDKAKAARQAAKDADLDTPPGVDAEPYQQFLKKKNDQMPIAQAIAVELGLTLPEIEVEDFRRSGYLPEVLCNYLALLGWSPGGDVERFGSDPLAFIEEHFSLKRVGKTNAKFDRAKLLKFNNEAIVALSPQDFCRRLRDYIERYHHEFRPILDHAPHFEIFSASVQERSKTLAEAIEYGRFFILADDAIVYDDKAVRKVLTKNEGEGRARLGQLREAFAAIEPSAWSGQAGHEAMRAMADAEPDLGMGKLAQPLRVAVSGRTVTPPIDHTLEILGREATLARIDRCLDRTSPCD